MNGKAGRPKGEVCGCPHVNREHYARGLCRACYRRVRLRERLKDKDFAEKWRSKHLRHVRDYQRRKEKEMPGYGAVRQQQWRKKHPQSFFLMLTVYYFKKLDKDKKKEFFRKVNGWF